MRSLLCVLLFSALSCAQEVKHNFFDKPARFALAGSAAVFASDAIRTCHDLGMGNVEAWLPVKHCRGISLWMAGNSAEQMGIAYLFHRSRHHRLERIVEFAGAAGSVIGLAWSFGHPPERSPIVPLNAGSGTRVVSFCIVGQTC
jgi:hypothetical protein